MTGGQDDAANLIHTSDGMTWDDVATMKAGIAKLRQCCELLETAVEAWETSRVYAVGGRRPYLSIEWHAKAKEAIDE